MPTTAAEQDAAIARVIGLPHILAKALALTGLGDLYQALGQYARAASRAAVARSAETWAWA